MLDGMTEQNPPNEDDTQRLPEDMHDRVGGSQHRYDPSVGQTSPYARPDQVGGFDFHADQDGPAPRRPGRSGRPGNGVIAGLLAAALVVGGVAGVAGAAGFSAVHDAVTGDSAPSSSAPAPSSPVINDKQVAPAADSVEQVSKAVLPSVVKINVKNSQEEGSGSGIIISSDGEILTNNHVASVAGKTGDISVSFNDGTAKKATVIGTDPLTDLAVIKAQGVSGLQPATIGKSEKIAVGENVVAIGSPFGLDATVTSGIVSAVNRPVSVGSSESGGQADGQTSQDTTYPAIQTDAAINPGNSGGPLVDLSGDVVGINSSIRTADSGLDSSSEGGSIGLGFAIPIDNVWPVVEQLRKGQTPTHARMGVSVADASSDGGLLSGAGVQAVDKGSAGQQAGLRKGDVITRLDGQVISGSESLVATVRGHRPGDKVTLTVVSGGKTRTVPVTLDSDGGSASS
jgi:putative serine protease PepD